jgi:hypothetical protein
MEHNRLLDRYATLNQPLDGVDFRGFYLKGRWILSEKPS